MMLWEPYRAIGGRAWRSGDWALRPWFGTTDLYVLTWRGQVVELHADPGALKATAEQQEQRAA
jgi:hypothetical protein